MKRSPKIILPSYFGHSGLPLGHSCADGFRQLGWDVCCVNNHEESLFYRYVFKRFNKLLKAVGLAQISTAGKYWPWAPLNHRRAQLRKAVETFRPDAILLFNPFPNVYGTEFLLGLKKICPTKLVGWNVDGPYDDLIAHSKADAKVFDKYFCIHRHGYSSADKIQYLPAYALDAKRYFKLPTNIAPKRRIVFVGAYSPRREEFLSAIADLPLEIYGTAWRKQGSNATKHCVMANRIWGNDLLKLMNESIIVLNISSWDPKKTGLSLRVVDIPATGAFMLTDEAPELTDIFGNQISVPTFKYPADLRRQVKHFLDADEERRALANRMHEHILRTDTYADRMRTIANEITIESPLVL
ncbi:MAG: CgeB family protein [Sulfuricella sp.]